MIDDRWYIPAGWRHLIIGPNTVPSFSDAANLAAWNSLIIMHTAAP